MKESTSITGMGPRKNDTSDRMIDLGDRIMRRESQLELFLDSSSGIYRLNLVFAVLSLKFSILLGSLKMIFIILKNSRA